jgi:glycosyltransferase involved in cell wall biosynthesis
MVEIHVVSPHNGISHLHEYESDGIYYHVFWSEWDIILEKIKRRMNLRSVNSFKNHRKMISRVISAINPDIVHVVGIENKFHSMAILDLPPSLPVIAQLQTLVSDARFKDNCSLSDKEYQFDSEIEKMILKRANYIGTTVERFRKIISEEIKPEATFVNTTLALTEKVNDSETDKAFDFVYFAADISKAADWAIEAFALTQKKHPSIKLDIIGGFSKEYRQVLDNRISELGLTSHVTFEGKLPTHQDVIDQIRKSHFAILPLKIDLVSGTIREAMANGIPVVTTETPMTPALNAKIQSILIAPNGDFQAMSDRMCDLLEKPQLADTVRKNALSLASVRKSNKDIISDWVRTYYKIMGKTNR